MPLHLSVLFQVLAVIAVAFAAAAWPVRDWLQKEIFGVEENPALAKPQGPWQLPNSRRELTKEEIDEILRYI